MLLVTFHGGSGGQNNVGAYADSGSNIGTELSLAVLSVPDPKLLSELRGIQFVADGVLWVTSGAKNASAVLAFKGSGTSYASTGTPVVEYASVNSLWHPFDFAFDGNSNCYVSDQDTDVVVRLAVGADFLSATPTPVAPALPPGTYLDATFVASSNGDLPGVPATTAVPAPAGLEVAFDCKPSRVSVANSVRGVVWALGCLYVADEVANAVKVYGPTGEYLGQSKPVIGRVTPSGIITEFYLPTGTKPQEITNGPDGKLWFTDRSDNQIGRITTDGQVGLFTLATPSYPQQITTGPDGRLWFTMQAPARIGAFTPFAPAPSQPDIRRIEPPDSTTNGGTTVLITGYSIGTATQVLFGTTPATSFHAIGPSQIEAVAPPHTAGEVDVTVVTPSATTAASEGSKFFYSSLACGKVITQSTTLSADIGPCYHDGVIVRADNITLDLGGKRVFSFTRPSDGNAAGIRLPMRTGVTVKHGTVSGFDAGVVLHGGGSNILTSLTVKDNIGPDTINSTLGDGIFIEASAANKVTNNTISHNGIFDGIGIYEPQSNSNIVENNVVEKTSDGGPAGQGIIINGATEGATPTHIESTRVANNVVRDNASAGIANINHVRGSIVGNTVVGNGATNSVGNGIGVSVGFIWKGITQMLIKDNKVHGNGVDGIRIAANATGGNRVFNNDAANNNANPAANTYEGGGRGFDLHDLNANCAGDAWNANIWGSGGYSPACTTHGGSGPTVAAASGTQAPTPRGPNAEAWEQLLNRGRR